MKLATMMCPCCGGDKLEARNGGAFCPHCGREFVAEFLDEQEALLDALGTAKQEALAHARRMLYDAAHAENISSEQLKRGATEVKKYAPDDFLASFYEAACNDDARVVNGFLDGVNAAVQGKMFLMDVCEFMLSSLTKRNLVAFKAFLERAHVAGVFTSGEYTGYLTRTEKEAEKLDNGVYDADLPRDVFIAYSSRDMAEVNALTDFLEGEGLSCFVALRNLRHGKGAAENYQRLLETAMRNCKSVVFVSTQYSRDRSCDALAVELPYLREHRADIYRVEYRPASDSGKTTTGAKILLEAFFENLEYARTCEDVLERLIKHKYGLDKPAQQVEAQPAPQPKPAPAPEPAPQPKPAPAPEPAPQPKPAPAPAQPQLPAEKLYAEGRRYYNSKDYNKAVEYFRKAKAVEYFRKAADLGYVYAQNSLGVCYANGKGVPQDYEKAVEWYRKAAAQGHAWSQNDLGDCYYDGKGVPQDYEKAVEWYTKAAAQGNAVAQNNLGNCYYYGRGVPQDYEKAVEWYRKAAEQGHAGAQKNLGDCYYNGEGVPQDYEKAVEWYTKAAGKGHAAAQFNLGNCYKNGQGVPQNYKKAVEWYRKAAEQGNAVAQDWFGFCYEYGHGVPRDISKAIEWYEKAAAQGNNNAKEALARLKK